MHSEVSSSVSLLKTKSFFFVILTADAALQMVTTRVPYLGVTDTAHDAETRRKSFAFDGRLHTIRWTHAHTHTHTLFATKWGNRIIELRNCYIMVVCLVSMSIAMRLKSWLCWIDMTILSPACLCAYWNVQQRRINVQCKWNYWLSFLPLKRRNLICNGMMLKFIKWKLKSEHKRNFQQREL